MKLPRLLLHCALSMASLRGSAIAAQQLAVGPEHELAGAHTLTRISAAAFGPEGLIAVTQPVASQVMLFDLVRPDRAIATLGRLGAGPGEFAQLGNIGWIGDTLWVTDPTRPRAEYFLLDGKYLASRNHNPALPTRKFARYTGPSLILRGGAAVFAPAVAIGPSGIPTELRDELLPVLLARPGAPQLPSIAYLQLFRSVVQLDGDRGSGAVPQPFATVDLVRSGADGSRLVVVEQTAAATSGGPSWVRVYNASGAELGRKELDIPRFQVSNSEWDSVLTAWSGGSLGREMWSSPAQAKNDMRAVIPRPKYLPAVAAAVVGRDGRIWLRHSRDKAGKGSWTILSATGEKVGTLELPSAVRVLDATATEILGARADADGVEHLVLIPIVSP